MKDEHREKLDKRLTPIHLYKLTPKTNCGQCGLDSCLAFATQVIVGQADLQACPFLEPAELEPFRIQLEEQHRSGIGVKREGFEKALTFLRGELKKCDFPGIAPKLGGQMTQLDGQPALRLDYFGRPVLVTHEDASMESDESLNPYEKILIFNYILGSGAEPSGSWVGMETLPNSVSKVKSLISHCQEPLAKASTGRISILPEIASRWGTSVQLSEERVDFAAEFPVLPKLSIRVLWWDEDPAEGFQAHTKYLFDSRVLQIIDLESLVFASEQITDRLLNGLNEP